MKGNRRGKAERLLLVLALLLLAFQVVPRWGMESLSMDEEWDLANAAYYWHDLDASLKDGPLPLTGSLTGLPSRFLSLSYGPIPEGSSPEARAYYFLYYLNRPLLGAIAVSGRIVSLMAALGIGLLIFRLARSRGPFFIAAALAFWAFDPMVLGYAGVARNDMTAAFLSMAAWVIHLGTRRNGASSWDPGWTGMVAGMALLTKPTTFFLLPAILGMEVLDLVRDPERPWRRCLARAAAFLSGAVLWVFLAYLPTALAVRPPASPFDLFARYIAWILKFDGIGSDPYFLGGTHGTAGFLAFPVSVFFKWTLPFTGWVLLGLLLAAWRRTARLPEILVPLAAMVLTLLPGISSKLCRHLLPVYPFLILVAAVAASWAWEKARGSSHPRVAAALVLLGLAWHPLSSLARFPHALSYMNDLVPRHRKAEVLSSYNWDLNQDVKRLAATARERGWGTVRLANSGRVDPFFYGLEWEPWTREDLEEPRPGTVYVLNASLMTAPDAYLGPFAGVKKSWAAKREPTGWVADTWVYHEIPGAPAPGRGEVVNSFPYFRIDLIPYRMNPALP